ncbi:hypothetical protein [Coprococcus comes]|uniref:hypothetical protein n=1 Tax=Coprococcus comes TaxID=410072 RepID=UPI001A9B6302|nr:hypothetical protein [Coprococcus comes]
MKIRISYENERELAIMLDILQPLEVKCKRSGNQEGRYKKAYIDIPPVVFESKK